MGTGPARDATTASLRAAGALVLLAVLLAMSSMTLVTTAPSPSASAGVGHGGDANSPASVRDPTSDIATFPVKWTPGPGLNASNWSVTVGGRTSTTDATSLTINEPNGSYSWTASAFRPWNASGPDLTATGTLQVDGTPLEVTFNWTASPASAVAGGPATSSSTPGVSPVPWLVLALGGVVAAVLVGAGLRAVRKSEHPTPPPATSSSTLPPRGPPAEPPRGDPTETDDPLGHLL